MNKDMKAALDKALHEIENMSDEEFYKQFYGYSHEEYEAYNEEKFLAELEYLKGFMQDGTYIFDVQYDDSPVPEMSKLFWRFAENHARSAFYEPKEMFTTYREELPQYKLRITRVHGQGTITTVEEFDFTSMEYIATNATRLKREGYEREREEIMQFMKDLPKDLDEVQFSTLIGDEKVVDTGVVTGYRIKDRTVKTVLYHIDSTNHGKVQIYINNDKFPLDTVMVTDSYYGADDEY